MDNQQSPDVASVAVPSAVQTPAASLTSPTLTNRHTAVWLMLLMLFIFPPLGWYFMWKEKAYHTWFATTIFIYGLFGFALNALIIVYVVPYLPELYNGLGIADPSPIPAKYSLVLGVLISDAMMFFGIYIWNYIKKHGQLDGKLLVITGILLFINYVVPTISAIVSAWWIVGTLNEVTNAVK